MSMQVKTHVLSEKKFVCVVFLLLMCAAKPHAAPPPPDIPFVTSQRRVSRVDFRLISTLNNVLINRWSA